MLALAAVAAGAWALLLAGHGEMQTSAAPFLVGWTVMMAAMMLPSVGPLACGAGARCRRGGGVRNRIMKEV